MCAWARRCLGRQLRWGQPKLLWTRADDRCRMQVSGARLMGEARRQKKKKEKEAVFKKRHAEDRGRRRAASAAALGSGRRHEGRRSGERLAVGDGRHWARF